MCNSESNLLKKEIENLLLGKAIKITCDDCPLDGDASNCSICAYNGDYFYLNGECVSKNCQGSKWKQISVLCPVYSGTNDEIKSIPIIAWDFVEHQTEENGKIIAVVWEDLSKMNTRGIDYKDEDAKTDYYSLSCIIETLRDI